ncbi:uncharacterized protein N7443_007868 [Penicillium atrosanguineum]|uniref:uncharacterized protein n=1 Tax=Penicillium atrosanguineum TaxID=1132637 RepID=UPI002395FF3E|nr:uncharacterized protein N7443_007868 [Penicillium atrosanguineum]KAJ5296975.1 hypothetical protein N7443_007868 [Penicillium atrosanguineum]
MEAEAAGDPTRDPTNPAKDDDYGAGRRARERLAIYVTTAIIHVFSTARTSRGHCEAHTRVAGARRTQRYLNIAGIIGDFALRRRSRSYKARTDELTIGEFIIAQSSNSNKDEIDQLGCSTLNVSDWDMCQLPGGQESSSDSEDSSPSREGRPRPRAQMSSKVPQEMENQRDGNAQQWFGGCFCWNNIKSNVFDPAVELSSLLGFGSSLMAKCNLVESLISNRQKADFLDSISYVIAEATRARNITYNMSQRQSA